ncbi:LuxR C-terminal-related transcriptional regulator [Shimia aestuarii]|uniref:ATP-, maltotriose-and DNA-dependent transcriptional regulator MalT n=1 Tax=Shimia aestuarii TaxID=254406 RepID=A0A1I4SMW4_9RHOB|nr:LuxR C-terminal-related transcriptional regulator [Shimia aestuarii]SFM65772.1 ATP-, maltotriose-and DNA-dependent transcriptional regulator MalT [Shimia aestuarii]
MEAIEVSQAGAALVQDPDALTQGTISKVFWAPPGFGKTWHLREAMARADASGSATVWISCKMISTRFPALITRLESLLGEAGVQLALSREMSPPVVAELIVQNTANVPIAIFVDNFDDITDEDTLIFFRLLSMHRSGRLRLSLATWNRPRLDLVQLGLDQKVEILGIEQLRLSTAEVVNRFPGLSTKEKKRLLKLTGKWPGAIMLAAQLKVENSAAVQWLDHLSPRLLTYLQEQVLSHLPLEMVDVLLALSQIDMFEGSLIEKLSGKGPGWEMLVRIRDLGLAHSCNPDESLFCVSAPFRTHFRTMFLRKSAEFQSNTCQMMAEWFSDKYAYHTALQLADKVRDRTLLATMIEKAGSWRLAVDGSNEILSRYLPKLDEQTFCASPRIRLADALHVARSGDPELGRRKLNELRETMQFEDKLSIEVEIVDALVAISEDRLASRDKIEQLKQIYTKLPGTATLLHADVNYILFFFYYETGDLHNAVKAAQRVQTVLIATRQDSSRLHLEVHLGAVLHSMGHLSRAKVCLKSVIRESRDSYGPESLFEALASLHLASILYQQNQIQEASALIAKSLHLLERTEIWCTPLILGYRVAANIARVGSGHAGVIETLGRADRTAEERRLPRLKQVVSILRIIENIKSGKRVLAFAAANEIGLEKLARLDPPNPNMPPSMDSQIVVNFARVALARVWISSGDAAKATDMLNRTCEVASANGATNYRIRAIALRAIAEDALGHRQKAIESLLEAASLGQHENYFRVFLDLGLPMERLIGIALRTLPKAQRYLTKYQYLSMLHEAFQSQAQSISVLAGGVELTRKEMEVVDLLGAGMTNAEMAKTLSVTTDTIKFHLKKIYRKFGVKRREDVIPKIERDFR